MESRRKETSSGSIRGIRTELPHSHERKASIVALSQVACSRETADTVELLLSPKEVHFTIQSLLRLIHVLLSCSSELLLLLLFT